MKLLATMLCFFLLLLLVGTCSYVYILWHHYWIRVEKLVEDQNRYQKVASIRFDDGRLRALGRHKIQKTTPSTQIPKDKLLSHIDHYENQIVNQLKNAVLETGKGLRAGEVQNVYNVKYRGKMAKRSKEDLTPEELVCETRNSVKISTFVKGDEFFEKQQLDQFFLPHQLLFNRTFDSCGVVSSSGSLVDSKLGSHIDANEFVIRFNNAPTKGHERDVGKKTSLRIVNSQVVGKPEFRFLESRTQLYTQAPILVWDPSGYKASLKEWYNNPDYPFFETFFSKRLMRPTEELYLLHPQSLWSLWDWLQTHTRYPLLPNPPSSGFLGIALALSHCRRVQVYEYLPSMRLTKRCHYYDEEENLGCTMGDWHPLAAEKLVALAMSVNNKTEVFYEGFLTLPGLPGLDCEDVEENRPVV